MAWIAERSNCQFPSRIAQGTEGILFRWYLHITPRMMTGHNCHDDKDTGIAYRVWTSVNDRFSNRAIHWNSFCPYYMTSDQNTVIFCVLSGYVVWSQGMNSIHASLMKSLYMLLCTLVLFRSITRFTETSAIIPVSMHTSRRPASWKRIPIIDITLQIVWNVPRRSMMLIYRSAYFGTLSIQSLVNDHNDVLQV